MPRTLPWMNGGSIKKEKRAAPTPPARQKRASSVHSDIVNSDLEDVHPPNPPLRQRERITTREPSTSPPPGPPPAEAMRSGFAHDDIFRMVEDEFLSTAQLYTAHIHHAEYARLKALHRSRGRVTLSELERATDGKTAQSAALQMQKEKERNAKRQKEGIRKINGEQEQDSEDEYLHDPQLRGLMINSQAQVKTGTLKGLKGLERPKADTRAAAGLEGSPFRPRTTTLYPEDENVYAGEMEPVGAKGKQRVNQRATWTMPANQDQDDEEAEPKPKIVPKEEDENEDEASTEDDDLDAPVRSKAKHLAVTPWADKVAATMSSRISHNDESRPHKYSKQIKTERPPSPTFPSARPSARDPPALHASQETTIRIKDEPTNSQASPVRTTNASTLIARRREERRAAAEAKLSKAKNKDVPTFLI